MNLKLIIWSLIFVCQVIPAQTLRLTDFEKLINALNTGERVRVIMHYGQCQWADENMADTPLPKAVSGMDIDTYEYFEPGVVHNKLAFVVFSNAKLIQNPKGKGYVYNYGKIRINSDNTVTITARYIDVKRFKTVMDETFKTTINDGTNGGALDLFVSRKE